MNLHCRVERMWYQPRVQQATSRRGQLYRDEVRRELLPLLSRDADHT